MNHLEFQIAAAGALFVTFLIGWLCGWLVHRAGQGAALAVPQPLPEPPPAQDDAALSAARAELHEAQVEIEELRAYIERKLARTADTD